MKSAKQKVKAATLPVKPSGAAILRRKCACGQHTIAGGECDACNKKHDSSLKRSAINHEPAHRPNGVPAVVHEVLRSSGQPLDPDTRAFMEPRFGHDLSRVRVHTDSKAGESALAVNALAYTVGQEVVFGAGQYAPRTSSGQRLLAHELTHTVQQHVGAPPSDHVSDASDPHERHADNMARTVAEGRLARPLREADKLAPAERRAIRPMIQRQAPTATQTPSPVLPSADELAARIARSIGIWETNRGKNDPAPKESKLDTFAGVPASMATLEQATMPYAIEALKKHQVLRDKAEPPLTVKEVKEAEARSRAVDTLLKSVSTASKNGQTPDDFIKDSADAIAATGLSDADVRTMFKAVILKGTIDTARASIEEAGKTAKQEAAKEKKTTKKKQAAAEKTAKKTALKEAIDAIPAPDRLGLDESSLKAYINVKIHWGEHAAAWKRKAIAAMPNSIGTRIESVAVSSGGTALVIPVTKSRVDVQLAKKPALSLEEIVTAVAQQNNSKDPKYGQKVWGTYQRIYP